MAPATTSSRSAWRRFVDWCNRVGRAINVPVTPRRLHLFELCDQEWYPAFLRRRCQAMLTAQWTHRLPLVQKQAPAELAAQLIHDTLEQIPPASRPIRVIDFCSGGGGPTPHICATLNARRAAQHQPPLPFVLTDLQPHLPQWRHHAAHNPHITYLGHPVDATSPPPTLLALPGPSLHHLALSFHHFSPGPASALLHSSTATASALALVELQDRRLASILLLLADLPLLLLVTPLWFWRDPLTLLFTYAIPILPLTLVWDGLVSCLRTYEWPEVRDMVARAQGLAPAQVPPEQRRYAPDGTVVRRVRVGDWVLEGGRRCHSWPLGWMNWVVGWRVGEGEREMEGKEHEKEKEEKRKDV